MKTVRKATHSRGTRLQYGARAGTQPVTAPGWTAKPTAGIAIIDCDVHQNVTKLEDLLPYLPRIYREHFLDQGIPMPSSGYFNVSVRAVRSDLSDEQDAYDARDFCSTYEFLRDRHLDPWNIDYALLTSSPGLYGVCVLPDADYAAAICRAMNDLTLEKWIPRDKRLKMCLMVSPSDPRQAAKEVDRVGDRLEVVAVIVPTAAQMPYGNRFYHPLWEACERQGLAVFVHPGGVGAGIASPVSAVGYPTYYMEERMARPSQASAHCASLICEGVFEKFPGLRFAFIEVQQYWAVGLMWHMDADWKMLRYQTPWLKKLPSEYFRQHIRVGSQPLHEPKRPEQLFEMLHAMHAEETMIYCSDFPHYDWGDPQTTFPKLPDDLHQRIFADNARELLGL